MKPSSHNVRDADLDGPDDSVLNSKRPKSHVKIWIVVGVAVISVGWGAGSLFVFLRKERSLGRSMGLPEADPVQRQTRRDVPELLLEKAPPSIRSQGFPTSQVDLAFAMRRAEERNLKGSSDAHGSRVISPTDAQVAASDTIRSYVSPGLRIDGWIMRVNWSMLRDRGGGSAFSYNGCPPLYEVNLQLPQDLAGVPVSLWGHNFDFRSMEYTYPNRKLEPIKDGDWVRVFGVLRPASRVEWGHTKSDALLFLGEMMISDIQKVEAIR